MGSVRKRLEATENEADKAKYREWLDTCEAIIYERIPCTQEAWDAMSEAERSEHMIALPEGIACAQVEWDLMASSKKTRLRMAEHGETKAIPGTVAAECAPGNREAAANYQRWLDTHFLIEKWVEDQT
jgi:hypothetical protein